MKGIWRKVGLGEKYYEQNLMGFILANRDLLLETILHYVPRMERKNVMEQHAFFISTINDKISNGKKFILEYDDLKTLVSVIFLYRLVVAPLEHAEDFYNRMNRFGVSSVTLGRYSLDGAGVERNSQIIARFHGMVKEFFEKKVFKIGKESLKSKQL